MFICMVGRDGRQTPLLTFDPWSRRWIYMLTIGSYGILRSPGWESRVEISAEELSDLSQPRGSSVWDIGE